MKKTVSISKSSLSNFLKIFYAVRNFNGTTPSFWKIYIDSLAKVSGADAGVIIVKTSDETKIWQPVVLWPLDTTQNNRTIQKLLATIQNDLPAFPETGVQISPSDNATIYLVKVSVNNGTDNCLALLHTTNQSDDIVAEKQALLSYAHDFPAIYQVKKSVNEALLRKNQFASILDLLVLINEKERFLSAAMAFCNELATRHHCDRVSLGWLKNKYIRLQAMSHSDDFDKKMDAVKKLELAMEESFEQNMEIVIPTSDDSKCITHDHEQFARLQDVRYLCSIPLRINNEPKAVCTLERNDNAFIQDEIVLLDLTCDQAIKRLDNLKNSDRWIGTLLFDKIKHLTGKLLGFNHTGLKLIGIIVTLILAILFFIPVTYRLESPVIIRTDSVAFLTAPFNSHIDNVSVRVGDEVREEQELLSLDRNELVLEEARLEAEKNRYQSESEKALAVDELADMRIAEALKNQASARLDLIKYQLSQVRIIAPFDGVVVEGDQMERIGAPVQQGDVLFKIARIEKMYAEIEVPEAEIHNVATDMSGEIALASKPQYTFGIKLFRIEPAAVVKDKGNVFIVHGAFNDSIPKWWRPGMTGIAKLHAGKKTLIWILTHRTIDFLRLKLWW